MMEEAQLDYKEYQFEWGLTCTSCNILIYLADPIFFKIDSIKSDFFNGYYTHFSYYTWTATLVGFFTSGTQYLPLHLHTCQCGLV